MASGRSAQLQQLYDLSVGETMELRPAVDNDLLAFVLRLKQVTTKYLREGRAYRLEIRDDYILATRVEVGSHRKLSYLLDLKYGERWFAGANLDFKERKALLARCTRMNLQYAQVGTWSAEKDAHGFWVRRHWTGSEELHWAEIPGNRRAAVSLSK